MKKSGLMAGSGGGARRMASWGKASDQQMIARMRKALAMVVEAAD
jgi:hypothetical protein